MYYALVEMPESQAFYLFCFYSQKLRDKFAVKMQQDRREQYGAAGMPVIKFECSGTPDRFTDSTDDYDCHHITVGATILNEQGAILPEWLTVAWCREAYKS